MYKGKHPTRARSVSYTKQMGLHAQANSGQWYRVQTKDVPQGAALPRVGVELPAWVLAKPQ